MASSPIRPVEVTEIRLHPGEAAGVQSSSTPPPPPHPFVAPPPSGGAEISKAARGYFVSAIATGLPSPTTSQIDELRRDLAEMRTLLQKIQTERERNQTGPELTPTMQQIEKLVEKAQEKTKELTAPVLLPSPQDIEVRLVASHSLDRLEEYRADESLYFLLIGLFGGAVLGILSNWFTNETLTMTRFSIVFIIFLGILM